MIQNLVSIFLIALSLSVDTLAVTICGSVSLGKVSFAKVLRTACVFGLVQGLFIFAGWIAGFGISFFVEKIAPFIGLALLLFIGGNMIIGAAKTLIAERRGEDPDAEAKSVNFNGLWSLVLAGVATSIDALAVGASMALGGTSVGQMGINSVVVFTITALTAVVGITAGKYIGHRFGHYASILGGAVLISIGVVIAFF